MATDSADRSRPEWPPHPDRVFMALAASYFETDGDERERTALGWLESQDPPGILASGYSERDTQTAFVPVNDSTPPKVRPGRPPTPEQTESGVQLLPERRGRQPRQFPVAVPHNPTVYLAWDSEPPQEVREGLESLCSKMIRVGHSASMVQAWVEDQPLVPNLVPTEGVPMASLRVPGPGRLAHLEQQYANERRPERSRWAAYARPRPDGPPEIAGPVFDSQMLVLRRVEGRLLGLESTLVLMEGLRNTIVKCCPEPVPEWVSGHSSDGRPSQRPHLAFLPLPYVGSEHADGHLLGVALAIPSHVAQGEVARCLNPVLGFRPDGSLRTVHVYEGRIFDWQLEMERRDSSPRALRNGTWTRESKQWATVTPIVFERHPKGRDKDAQLEEMIKQACDRAGLPRPSGVVMTPVSLHEGTPHSRDFPPLHRKSDNGRMRHSHVVCTFDEPVRGPVLLGAGKYRGYGLCKPVSGAREGD